MLLPDAQCGASLLVSPVFARLPRVRHGFSTRSLGDAAAPFGGDALERALGGSAGRWTRHGLRQEHGVVVLEASEATATDPPPPGDGLVTTRRGHLLVIRTADCLPILLAAVGTGGVLALAAVHAGWRGLVAGIVPRALACIGEAAPGARIVAAFGPAIGPCCFEVGPEVAAPLAAAGGAACVTPGQGDRSLADLSVVARAQLATGGAAIPDPQPPPCTRCHGELFPSWRRDGAAATRLASFVGLEPA